MESSRTRQAPPPVGGPFALVDHSGRGVTDRSFLGRKVLMLFGFTHCRVVCPRSLRKISLALDTLGPIAAEWVPLYVTVDPERDDAETMRVFLIDYPRFTGLTGSRAQIDRMKDTYRVYARRRAEEKEEDDDDGDYVIAHTTLAYVLDEQGAFSTHFPLTLEYDELVERLRAISSRDELKLKD